MNEFIIDFTYRRAAYSGLVTPKTLRDGDNGYEVKLESENQEIHLEIMANPCGDGKTDWCFTGDDEASNYDKDLLKEIGEAIEKYETRSS